MYYYAQVEDYFINYLFQKDNSFTRLANTRKLIDTIIYSKEQIQILKKMHPELITLSYGRATVETRSLHRKKFSDISNDQKHLIIKYLNI